MQITEIRVCLKESDDKKLKAYVTVTFDKCFVVRDIKVIDGNKGLFVAMPSRKLKKHCPSCQSKNLVRSKYCSFCGNLLDWNSEEEQLAQTGHRDVAHPILPEMRKYLQDKVLDEYSRELKKQAHYRVPSAVVEGPPSAVAEGLPSAVAEDQPSGNSELLMN